MTPAIAGPTSRPSRVMIDAALPERSASVYVHFPYCLEKCPYCDFVSYVEPRIEHEVYADSVIAELNARAPLAASLRIESVFFGGGTPSLWRPGALGRVLRAIGTTLTTAPDCEITIECNPTSLDERRVAELLDAGVNRFSIGVQSLDSGRLRTLGRLHDGEGALEAIRGARRAGAERVSADLIFGLPGQSPDEARTEALALAAEGLEHLSAYQLTIEPGTRFGELARRGRLPLADDGAVAESFLAIDDALESVGLRHYEVSNYACPGQEARHNLSYWAGREYLGLGCAAVGYLRLESDVGRVCGVRWRNAVRPTPYIAAASVLSAPAATSTLGRAIEGDARFASPLVESLEHLDGETLLRERIMLGLRVHSGLALGHAARELGVEGWTRPRLRARDLLAARGRLIAVGDHVRIPRGAWLWVDDTAARLL